MSGLEATNAWMGSNSRTALHVSRGGRSMPGRQALRLQNEAVRPRASSTRERLPMRLGRTELARESVHDLSGQLDSFHDYTNLEPHPKSLIALPMSSRSSPRIRENRH